MRVQGTNADYESKDFDEEGDEERDGEGEEEEEENEEEDRSACTMAAFTRQFPHLNRAGLPNTLIFLIHSGLVPYMESITILGK